MAAGTLPEPGTRYGPCEGGCIHTDCAATRRTAESLCPRCGFAIGYENRFYAVDVQGDAFTYAHALCEEREAGA